MDKDDTYIEHILERASKIIQFTEGMSENDFVKDEKTQSAVIRELEVIGEATKRISDNYRNANLLIGLALISNSFAQTCQWAKNIGSASDDWGYSIATNPASGGGNV